MSTESNSPFVLQIGEAAGQVWHVLAAEETVSFTKLVKAVDAPRDMVMQAVGWLARENKIEIIESSRGRTISLTPSEVQKKETLQFIEAA